MPEPTHRSSERIEAVRREFRDDFSTRWWIPDQPATDGIGGTYLGGYYIVPNVIQAAIESAVRAEYAPLVAAARELSVHWSAGYMVEQAPLIEALRAALEQVEGATNPNRERA